MTGLFSLLRGENAGERRTINRAPSEVLSLMVPWLSVLVASLTALLPFIPSALIAPPVGFIVFIAWRILRPGLFPVWAGFPLGLFDDLFSGQPFGSGALLWSLAMIVVEMSDSRVRSPGFIFDWLLGTALVLVYLLAGLALANLGGGSTPLAILLPQAVVSVLSVPLLTRLVVWLDRMRLTPLSLPSLTTP